MFTTYCHFRLSTARKNLSQYIRRWVQQNLNPIKKKKCSGYSSGVEKKGKKIFKKLSTSGSCL
jgi:3-methyladenine DNA glycosylase AlkC